MNEQRMYYWVDGNAEGSVVWIDGVPYSSSGWPRFDLFPRLSRLARWVRRAT